MPMHTEALSVGVWYELVDLDDDTFAQFWIDGSDPVHVALEVAEPDAGAGGAPLAVDSINQVVIPEGKKCFVQLQSGTGDVIYSQFNGITMDPARCGYGFSGDTGGDEDWIPGTDVEAGWDDASVRAGANPYEFRAFMETDGAVGIGAADTIQAAILSVYPISNPLGRTIRVYGVASISSVFSSITNWTQLDALGLTTAFADLVIPAGPSLQWDVKAIVEELQAYPGWDNTKPLAFVFIDEGTEDSGEDTRLLIDCTQRLTNVTILLA